MSSPHSKLMPHLPDTSGIFSLNSPGTTITFIVTRLFLGWLSSVVKIGNTGREEPVCPDEPKKSLPDLGKSLKAPPLHLYPEKPPETPLKSPQNKLKIL